MFHCMKKFRGERQTEDLSEKGQLLSNQLHEGHDNINIACSSNKDVKKTRQLLPQQMLRNDDCTYQTDENVNCNQQNIKYI